MANLFKAASSAYETIQRTALEESLSPATWAQMMCELLRPLLKADATLRVLGSDSVLALAIGRRFTRDVERIPGVLVQELQTLWGPMLPSIAALAEKEHDVDVILHKMGWRGHDRTLNQPKVKTHSEPSESEVDAESDNDTQRDPDVIAISSDSEGETHPMGQATKRAKLDDAARVRRALPQLSHKILVGSARCERCKSGGVNECRRPTTGRCNLGACRRCIGVKKSCIVSGARKSTRLRKRARRDSTGGQ